MEETVYIYAKKGIIIEGKAKLLERQFVYTAEGETFEIPFSEIRWIELDHTKTDSILVVSPILAPVCRLYFRGERKNQRAQAFFEALKNKIEKEGRKPSGFIYP
jgi:hypothetical protein